MSASRWRDLISIILKTYLRQSGHCQVLRGCAILQTFSGIYNICCLFNGKRKMPKLVIGLRSLIAIAEGLVGSVSLFYPNQTQMTFKLFETFISLAIVDLFLSASCIAILIVSCSLAVSACEKIQKENEDSNEDKAGLILRELADKSFRTCISVCLILGLTIAMALDAAIIAYGWDYTFGKKNIPKVQI